MELIVRAVDVGSGNTKFVTGVTGADIRCASFPSIAYPSSGETPHWPASERRKTVCIPVGPLFYEVGPDVGLAADTFRAKQLHDEYTESPEYTALLRGALSMMKVPHIDLLIVGRVGVVRLGLSEAVEIDSRDELRRADLVAFISPVLAPPPPVVALAQFVLEVARGAREHFADATRALVVGVFFQIAEVTERPFELSGARVVAQVVADVFQAVSEGFLAAPAFVPDGVESVVDFIEGVGECARSGVRGQRQN